MSSGSPRGESLKLESILHLSRLLGTSLKLGDVLENALIGLEEILQVEDSSIYEVDWQKGELFFRLARGPKGSELITRRIRIGEGVAGWVAQTGRPKIVGDTAREEQFFDGFDRELGYRTRSMLTVPLMSKGVVIGVVQLINKVDGHAFSREDLELAQIMAGLIAVALENARLYGRLEEKHQLAMDELARTQRQLIQSERQAALAGLAQGIAHQIRNPTMSIGGFARRIIQKSTPEMESIKRFAQVIQMESERLEELVRRVVFLINLKATPRREALKPVVHAALKAAVPQYPGLEIGLQAAENLPRLFFDPDLIRHALSEIFRNSSEAKASGIDLRIRVLDQWVLVEIQDDGPGLEAQDLAAALDPFFSLRAQNLGLGLSIVRRIMELHQGEVEVSSGDPQGLLVTLRFPLQAAL